jgi:hypothetical protein
MSKSDESFEQLVKDYDYVLEMKQTYDEAVERFRDEEGIDFGPFICIENTAIALDLLSFNLGKLIELAQLIAKEENNDQIN